MSSQSRGANNGLRWSTQEQCWIDQAGIRSYSRPKASPLPNSNGNPYYPQNSQRPSSSQIVYGQCSSRQTTNSQTQDSGLPNLRPNGTGPQRQYDGSSEFAAVPHRDVAPGLGSSSLLQSDFRSRSNPAQYFKTGRVFVAMWTGDPSDDVTLSTATEGARLSEYNLARSRKFIVVEEGHSWCRVIPILTYNNQGVSKQGVVKGDHAIVYTGKSPPSPLEAELPSRNEYGMLPTRIKVEVEDLTDKLSPFARLNFAKASTIQHTQKVKIFGMVSKNSMADLVYTFRSVQSRQSNAVGRANVP